MPSIVAETGLLIALAITPPPSDNGDIAADEDAECTIPEGWQDVAEREPRHVVFGELHGTRQAPAFLGSLACALARKGERILVAIELSFKDDPALQAAWNSSQDSFDEAVLLGGWAERADGVGSEAMFDLVGGLYRMKERGFEIGITAFSGPRDANQRHRFSHLPGQGPHEAAQAENIHRAARSGDYDRVLILVGDLHALKVRVDGFGPAFDPMARHGTSLVMERPSR